jgi:hypothetical protein
MQLITFSVIPFRNSRLPSPILCASVSLWHATLYDPGSDTCRSAGKMNIAREYYSATLLPNGDVLFVGGSNVSMGILNNAEIYRPAP